MSYLAVSPWQVTLGGIGGVLGTLFAGLCVKWIHQLTTPRRLFTLFLVGAAALGLFVAAGMLAARGSDSETHTGEAGEPTPTERPKPTQTMGAVTPTPTATTTAPFAARCGDVLPPEICEQRDPSRPWVRLKIGTVAVNEAGVLQFSVTLTNEGTDQGAVSVSNSDYDVAAWYAVDESGSMYRANDALSDSGIQSFVLFEDDSVSGFVRFRELNPDARCVTLFLPPFGEAGPMRIGGVATCQ